MSDTPQQPIIYQTSLPWRSLMELTIRALSAHSKWCQEISVEALAHAIPVETVRHVAQTARRPHSRERKLNPEVMLWLLIGLQLFPRVSMTSVLRKLTQGLRLLWPQPATVLVSASALVYRRAQLGVGPVATLFHAVCRPLATPADGSGAFALGWRVVALDGTLENVADTPANERAFGRRASQRGRSVYPQVLSLCLVECATHAIFEAGFWPATTSEHRVAPRLLRALTPEMLLLWDRGFHSVGLLRAVQARGAQALGRLPAHVRPQWLQQLPDGSALAYLSPGGAGRYDPHARLLVRIVTYRVRSPGAPTCAQANPDMTYRLVTTLLDPQQAPAQDLAALYQARWAIEETFDELDTHQRLATRTLRSQTPVGVLQELYGLLLAHYAVRATMYSAALQTQQAPDRLSFTTAVQLLCEAIPDFQLLAPSCWAARWALLFADIAQARLPPRRVRTHPRVVKRRASKFPQKRPGQHGTPRQTGSYADLLVVLPCG
jgi:hypothetical protein